MKLTKKLHIIIALVILSILAIPTYRWVYPPAHEHCIKVASNILYAYADENDGKYPASDKGWGDALLKLASTQDSNKWIPYFVGVDDDGSHLLEALANGTDVNEAVCTRVYVQGLNVDFPPNTAILYDRNSEPGGDHGRCRLRERVREVLTVDGSMERIKEKDWPEYVEKQRKLLRSQGFDETRITEIYGP